MPFKGSSRGGGVGDKRLYGPLGESRVPDEDGAEEEGACQVSPDCMSCEANTFKFTSVR